MKLFIKNKQGVAIQLATIAPTRFELANLIGSQWFIVNNETYHVNQVYAVTTSNKTAAGAIVGGLIGLLLGPEGLIIGGALGGVLGNSDDQTDIRRVKLFNQSNVL